MVRPLGRLLRGEQDALGPDGFRQCASEMNNVCVLWDWEAIPHQAYSTGVKKWNSLHLCPQTHHFEFIAERAKYNQRIRMADCITLLSKLYVNNTQCKHILSHTNNCVLKLGLDNNSTIIWSKAIEFILITVYDFNIRYTSRSECLLCYAASATGVMERHSVMSQYKSLV